MKDLSTVHYYRLTSLAHGVDRSLATPASGGGRLRMMPSDASREQQWRFVRTSDGNYALRTAYFGEGLSLDSIDNGAELVPCLTDTADAPGEEWVLNSAAGGAVTISNRCDGGARGLSAPGGVDTPILTRGDDSCGRWNLTQVGDVEAYAEVPPLDSGSAIQPCEGPTDFNVYRKPDGPAKSAILFVDFPQGRGVASVKDIAASLTGGGQAQDVLRVQSYGRLILDVEVPVPQWRTMPKASSDYARSFEETASHRDYIRAAARLYLAEVDFSKYSIVLIVPPAVSKLGRAAAFVAGKGHGAPSDTGEIRWAVTFGSESHTLRYTNLVHELGHLFGLPDLYRENSDATDSLAGGWALMSDIFHARGFLGWHRYKNEWLEPGRAAYLSTSVKGWRATLSPLDCKRGLSMVVLAIDDPSRPTAVFVVEVVQSGLGTNGTLKGEGVLLYSVDARIASGQSPVRVIPRLTGGSREFGNLSEAPYGVGDSTAHTRDGATVAVRVIGKTGRSYSIEVDYELR